MDLEDTEKNRRTIDFLCWEFSKYRQSSSFLRSIIQTLNLSSLIRRKKKKCIVSKHTIFCLILSPKSLSSSLFSIELFVKKKKFKSVWMRVLRKNDFQFIYPWTAPLTPSSVSSSELGAILGHSFDSDIFVFVTLVHERSNSDQRNNDSDKRGIKS